MLLILLSISVVWQITSAIGFNDLEKLTDFASGIGDKIKGYDTDQSVQEETNGRAAMILEAAHTVSNNLKSMETKFDQDLSVLIESLVERVTLIQTYNSTFLELHNLIVQLDQMYDKFISDSGQATKEPGQFSTLKEFVIAATSNQPGGLQDLLSQIHTLMLPMEHKHIRGSLLLTMVRNQQKTKLVTCDETISNQGTLYEIYHALALTEARGYVMTVVSYGLLPIFSKGMKGNYSAEVDRAEADFIMRTRDFLLAAKEAIRRASTQILRCDPKGGHRMGETYTEFRGLFQAYIVNEADAHPDDSCGDDCPRMNGETFRRKTDSANCKYQKPCYGRLSNCQYGGGDMSVCELPKNHSRRYEWFKESDGTTYGNSQSCPGQMIYPSSWHRWFYRCDYCICTCEAKQPSSDSLVAISLRQSEVNHQDNMVMIGVRIVEQDGLIHLQTREGKLLAKGGILRGSERWIPLDTFTYESKNHGDLGDFYRIHRGRKLLQHVGTDVEVIRMDQRIVHLDDIMVPDGHIATGIRFKHTNDAEQTKDNPLQIEILATPVDYDTGNIFGSKSKWKDSGDPKMNRRELIFDRPDNPLKYQKNEPAGDHNLYVKFRETDWRKDAGQGTIPFWDIQEVVTAPSAPLQGVGLFHKGSKDRRSGGFLALRIHTLEIAKLLNHTLAEETLCAYQLLYSEPLYSPEIRLK